MTPLWCHMGIVEYCFRRPCALCRAYSNNSWKWWKAVERVEMTMTCWRVRECERKPERAKLSEALVGYISKEFDSEKWRVKKVVVVLWVYTTNCWSYLDGNEYVLVIDTNNNNLHFYKWRDREREGEKEREREREREERDSVCVYYNYYYYYYYYYYYFY